MSRLRDHDRLRLRLLDRCLALLEEAHERNLSVVPPDIVTALRSCVPAVEVGMSVADGIALVLRQQEPHLDRRRTDVLTRLGPLRPRPAGARPRWVQALRSGETQPPVLPATSLHTPLTEGQPRRSCAAPRPTSGGDEKLRSLSPSGKASDGSVPCRPSTSAVSPPALLDTTQARALTEEIRESADHVCRLLVEAHSRRAWSALGYGSWEEYVRTELGLSRSRSYQLLDQARVIRAIEESIGVSRILDISPHAAGQLKPHLADVVEAVRMHAAGAPESCLPSIAGRVIQEERGRIARGDPPRSAAPTHGAAAAASGAPPRQDVGRGATVPVLDARAPRLRGRLADALTTLLQMPPVDQTLCQLQEATLLPVADLRVALLWLEQFVREWSSTRPE